MARNERDPSVAAGGAAAQQMERRDHVAQRQESQDERHVDQDGERQPFRRHALSVGAAGVRGAALERMAEPQQRNQQHEDHR